MNMINIRFETDGDIQQIHGLNEEAFGQPAEAELVDILRKRCPDILSLVAADNGNIIGHILFSPVYIERYADDFTGMGLGPMAVLPERQNQGIGSLLVREGLKLLRERGCPYVIVLGHSKYYPRFGFVPASRYGIACQWPNVPDEAFMALELIPNTLAGVKGVARYRPEFDDVT